MRGILMRERVDAENTFNAYRLFVEDLERLLCIEFGELSVRHENLIEIIRNNVKSNRPKHRNYSDSDLKNIRLSLARSWGILRTCWVSAEAEPYIAELNPLICVAMYYTICHASNALISTLGLSGVKSHQATINSLNASFSRGYFPFPWSTYCSGTHLDDSLTFGGFSKSVEEIHMLSRAQDRQLPDRIAAWLKSTRKNALEEAFSKKRVSSNLKRLNKGQKLKISEDFKKTSLFNVFYRLRVKANYKDGDHFSDGAKTSEDAKSFGVSVVNIADSTVFLLEAIVSEILGQNILLGWLEEYIANIGSSECLERHHRALSPF